MTARPATTFGTTQGLPLFLAHPLPSRLGGLCQAAVRRPGACAALSGALYASGGHLQSPPRQLCRGQGNLPMGLRPRKQKPVDALAAEEFLRRFLLHVLPRGFVRIRFFGLLANRQPSALLPLCRRLIADNAGSLAPSPPTIQDSSSSGSTCPICGGSMIVVERFTAQQLLTEFTRQVAFADTS